MTVQEMADKLMLHPLTQGDGMLREVSGCYIGDLLSWVMGRAKAGDAWLTVMGNVNAIAVATLADTACIVLTENAWLDEAAKEKAMQQEVAVLSTERNSYELALEIARLLGQGGA